MFSSCDWFTGSARFKPSEQVKLPIVGSSGNFTSYFGAMKWISKANSILHEGYTKHKNRAFKIAQLDRWRVIISGQELIEELRKAPDDNMSLEEALGEVLKYSLGQQLLDNTYHIHVLRTQLTRNLDSVFPDVKDEIMTAFEEIIPSSDNWVSVNALETFMKIVTRVSNRVFVGLPVCRDPEYIRLNMEYTKQVVKVAILVALTPCFLRPLVGRLFSPVNSGVSCAMKHLGPMIDDRVRKYALHGSAYPNKQNDLLSWLIEKAQGSEQEARNICIRVLAVNMAAIHTTSMTFTHAMFHLASKRQFIAPMREEVENVIKQDGWTKTAMSKLHKVDSFLKETLRFTGLSSLSISQIALQDYTFSDGTFIPKGTMVSAAAGAIHHDKGVYENANTFDGFRFSGFREQDGENLKHQMVSTSHDYLSFGHGRHACPGRFFAANELKAMLAHVLLTYDFRMEIDGIRPLDTGIFANTLPDPKARMLFRRRIVQ
ncbi:cytochrome P450 [Rickenella mellea]|uniref:Cytochrome P450 n=1 Tax=Rickenella mellea TaxID=50990 RepID=A0A4Y7PJ61_9AGAM|nr:cytochrome P450 [Rickenella mellea]